MKLYLLQILILVLGLLLMNACGGEGTDPIGGGSSSSANRKIEILNIQPTTLPSVLKDSFDVTIKIHDLYQGVNVHLEINSQSSTFCNAYTDSTNFISSLNPVKTIKVKTDSLLSNCISKNSIFRVVVWFRDTLDIIRRDSAYCQWGNPQNNGNTLSANVERWRMPYVSSILADTLGKCIIRSFNPGSDISDSNFLKFTINFTNLNITSKDSNFVVNNLEALTRVCDDYSFLHDNNGAIHNKIIYAKSHNLDGGVVGWSQSTGVNPPNDHRNWSYVFYENIENFFDSSKTINDTTYGNLTAFHEMLHQMGHMHGDKSHLLHTGYFSYKCALWNEDNHFSDELKNHRYKNKFRVCMNHTMQLSGFWNVIPMENIGGNVIYTNFIATNPLVRSAGRNSIDKYEIKMSLSKQEYKKYEPIIAKLTLINHDIEPLSIYNVHNYFSNEPKFVIKDINGQVYEYKNFAVFFIPYYTTDILPGDSLVFSMALNNWGKETSYFSNLSFDEIYFDQWGYFPPSEYSAYFMCNLADNENNSYKVVSNNVSYKVSDLSQEDSEVLRLYNEKKYNEVLSLYSNNNFTEHVFMEKLLNYWSEITIDTEPDYVKFIQTYPNSLYIYNWRFMLPYIKSAETKNGDFEKAIDYLLCNHESESEINKVLINKPFITIIKNYGKVIEKNINK